MSAVALLALALAGGIVAAAFFALAEGVLYATPGPRADEEPVASGPFRRADRVQHGVALGHVLAVVWVGATAWLLAAEVVGVRPGAWTWSAVVLGTGFVALVAGELAPRAVGTEEPWTWRQRLRRPLAVWLGVLWPVTSALAALERAIGRAVGPGVRDRALSSEEIRAVLTETTVRAAAGAGERQMIVSIFSFGETTVREVMTPRPDVFALEVDTPLDEALEAVRAAEHSRVPVYQGSLDEVRGILYARDLLAVVHDTERPEGLAPLLTEARFVPEAKRIDDLLREFQRERIHLAVVVDEYGGIEGIVTLEDILEELVGEIQDEYDREEPRVRTLPDGSLRLDAGLDADDFNVLTGSALEAEGVETIGGVVGRSLGRVAEEGDAIEAGGWRFTVDEVDGNRITRVVAARIGFDEGDRAEGVG